MLVESAPEVPWCAMHTFSDDNVKVASCWEACCFVVLGPIKAGAVVHCMLVQVSTCVVVAVIGRWS
jgi:hypothetical protein